MKFATLLWSILAVATIAHAETIHVSAAISLKESLESAAVAFETKTGTHIDLAVGASGMLATQISNGADADLFISAAQKQVDDLAAKKLVDLSSRVIVARNTLSLIVPKGSTIVKSFDDLKSPQVRRISAGEPKVVPAGDYAKQVIEHLKLTNALKDKLLFGANVRQVLDYVRRGEVDAGLVYRTDALTATDAVTIVADAEAGWSAPIEYPGVIINASSHKDAADAFLKFLASDAGQAELIKRGFAKGGAAQ